MKTIKAIFFWFTFPEEPSAFTVKLLLDRYYAAHMQSQWDSSRSVGGFDLCGFYSKLWIHSFWNTTEIKWCLDQHFENSLSFSEFVHKNANFEQGNSKQ